MKRIILFLGILILSLVLVGCQEDIPEIINDEKFEVKFLDYDDSVLKTESVLKGQSAISPEIPNRDGYTFKEWDKDFSNIQSNLNVKAVYSLNTYKVTFWGFDGIIEEVIVNHGETVIAPEVPNIEGYTFIGWDKTFETITGDLPVYAEYNTNTYLVSFVDNLGNEIATEYIPHGENASYPYVQSIEGYDFIGWQGSNENIKKDQVITAVYEKKSFKVDFYNIQGELLKSENVLYKEKATAPNIENGEWYTFISWEKDLEEITEDLSLIGEYQLQYNFEKFGNGWSINGFSDNTEAVESIYIPDKYRGEYVLQIDGFGNKGLLSVTFSEYSKIEIIGYRAFENNLLTKISIPESVYLIQSEAFKNNHINELLISKNIKFIYTNAFLGNQIKTLNFDPHSILEIIDEGAFADNQIETLIIPKSVVVLGRPSSYIFDHKGAFENNNLNEIKFEDGTQITNIGKYVFSHNNLSTIKLPSTLKVIDKDAFSNNNIKEIVIPNHIEEIKFGAFRDNIIETLIFEDNSSLHTLGGFTFAHNQISNKIVLPASLKSSNSGDFFNNLISEVEFSEGIQIERIGHHMFTNNRIISIVIPASIKEIGIEAFRNNEIETITFEDGSLLTKIDIYAFSNNKIRELNLPSLIEEIGEDSFAVNQIEYLSFGNNLVMKNIGNGAFAVNNLTAVVLPNSPVSIGGGAFSNNQLLSVSFPESVEKIGVGAFQGNQIETIIFSADGNLKEINEDAFYGHKATSIEIPASVTYIASRAFDPAHNQSFPYYIFEQFIVSENNLFYSSLNGVLYNKDKTVLIAYPKGKAQETFYIPNSVISIESFALRSLYHVKNIYVPASVLSVAINAFGGHFTTYIAHQEKPLEWDDNWYSSFGSYEVHWGVSS